MNLNKERKTEIVEYDIDISDQEADNLAKYGLEMIKNDKQELVNYAVNHILKQVTVDMEKDNKLLERLITKSKELDNKTPTKKRGRPRKEKI